MGQKNKVEFTLKAIGGGKTTAEHDSTIAGLPGYDISINCSLGIWVTNLSSVIEVHIMWTC